MKLFDIFNRTSQKKSITKNYVGDNIYITIPTQSGTFTIKAKTAQGPNGSIGVLYDCFLIALGQWVLQGMEESEFISDIRNVVEMIAQKISDTDVMYSLLSTHLSQKGRIIDSDMCTYISEIMIAKIAINGSCDRDILLDKMMQVAEKSFGDSLYITQYRHTNTGLQPYLVTFKDYINKNRK